MNIIIRKNVADFKILLSYPYSLSLQEETPFQPSTPVVRRTNKKFTK
jgi:hypothetical protein